MRYVIIGGSAAGISCAKTIKEMDKEGEVILISKDKHIISRCMLHQYLSGEKSLEALNFANPGDFFTAYDITWKRGCEVTAIDAKAHTVTCRGIEEETISFDKLLLATGANSFIPPVEGLREANHVVGFRNIEDVDFIKEKLGSIKNVVVLGAGLIGMDAVSGLLPYDVKVSLVEMGKRVLPLQLDDYTSDRYYEAFSQLGVNIKLGVAAQKVIVDENNNPTGLLLNTGEILPCELIIVATGVRANVEVIKAAGIECDHFGLIINAKGETNTRDIYGAGDVTGRNPIWPKAIKEGIVAGNNMVGNEIYMTDYFAFKNTMNFIGIPTLSLGVAIKPNESYKEVVQTRGRDYKKFIVKDGKVYGVLLQGDLSYAGVLTQLVRFKMNIEGIERPIVDIDYGDFFNIKQNQEYTY
nr:FAD-dependent oxidoreductase [uncultured Cellulosilyticum sp.]